MLIFDLVEFLDASEGHGALVSVSYTDNTAVLVFEDGFVYEMPAV